MRQWWAIVSGLPQPTRVRYEEERNKLRGKKVELNADNRPCSSTWRADLGAVVVEEVENLKRSCLADDIWVGSFWVDYNPDQKFCPMDHDDTGFYCYGDLSLTEREEMAAAVVHDSDEWIGELHQFFGNGMAHEVATIVAGICEGDGSAMMGVDFGVLDVAPAKDWIIQQYGRRYVKPN